MPIAKPDPVSASTSSGNAVKLTASPSDEIPWLTSRTLKSRFWASGMSIGSTSGWAAGSAGIGRWY